ncbi:MAG: hypothetical protein KDD33_03965 [Bdellovibrionales bacterium]|nr:hypothetical protein [Bdellovibrionales bacterium]
MKKILFVFIFLSFAIAQASGGGGHHETGVPMGTVMSQLVNLGLLIAILFFWQGKNIANAFAQKKENFLKSVEEANSAKKEAENKLKEVEHRLQELLENYKKSVDKEKKMQKKAIVLKSPMRAMTAKELKPRLKTHWKVKFTSKLKI